MADELTAKIAQPVEGINTPYQILAPVENTGIFDADGKEISGFRKETVNIEQLNQQRAMYQSQVDIIDQKLTAINKLKGQQNDTGTIGSVINN